MYIVDSKQQLVINRRYIGDQLVLLQKKTNCNECE